MLAIATAALLAFSATAEAATKYNYGSRGSHEPSYEHRVYGSEYRHEPSHDRHYADHDNRERDEDYYGGDAYSEEQSHEPRSAYSYRHKTKRSTDQDEGGERESLISSCCFCADKIRVQIISGSSNVGAKKVHPYIFTEYTMGKFTVHGKDHWISKDGKYAIWNKGGWWIGRESSLGVARGYARIDDSADCVQDTELKWRYWVNDIGKWINAEGGLGVRPV